MRLVLERREYIDPSEPEALSHGAVHVVIEVEPDRQDSDLPLSPQLVDERVLPDLALDLLDELFTSIEICL